MEITNEQIDRAFENLSDEWQEAIIDVDVDHKISEITEKYKLQLDSANTVYMETNYVILGLKKAEDFRAELAKDQKIPLQIIDSLVTDVNEQILEAIRMKIIENKEIDEAFEEIEPEAPVDVATIENKVAAIPTPAGENLIQTGGFVFNETKPEAVQVPVAQPTEIPFLPHHHQLQAV